MRNISPKSERFGQHVWVEVGLCVPRLEHSSMAITEGTTSGAMGASSRRQPRIKKGPFSRWTRTARCLSLEGAGAQPPRAVFRSNHAVRW